MKDAKRFMLGAMPEYKLDFFFGVEKDSPGGKKLPEMLENAQKGSAIISSISDITFPNETVTASGEGLENVSLAVWTEGFFEEVKPLRSDALKLQAVIPAHMNKSVTLIWPISSDGVGAPVRINAPEIWWCDKEYIYETQSSTEIRLFGSCLTLDGAVPTVIAELPDGKRELLKVRHSNPYQITVELHSPLVANTELKIAVHNETGGKYGWSNVFVLPVVEKMVVCEELLPILRVDDFGAVPNDGNDDIDAIEAAIKEAEKLGGAIIEFGFGEYNVSRTVTVPNFFPKGLYIRGVGMGHYDRGSMLRPSEYEYRGLKGKYTALRFLDPKNVPENTVKIVGDNVFVHDMTIYGADGHVSGYTMKYGYTVASSGSNVGFKNIRMIKCDLRDLNSAEDARLVSSNQLFIDTASRNVDVIDCEFHSKACAIWINFYDGPRYAQPVLLEDEKQVRHVKITGCRFINYTTPYVHPSGKHPAADEGEISRGITAMNCDGVIVENCLFEGADMAHDFVLTRSMYLPITANHMYIAENLMRNVGSTPGTGFDGNTGEQILFHGGLHLGGVYDVKGCKDGELIVRTDNIRLYNDDGSEINPEHTVTNAGSKIYDGLMKGNRGMAYICAGKGAGQIRRIAKYRIGDGEYGFMPEKPYIIEPDETSIVMETSPFRENIVYKNTIMKEERTMAQGFKSGGVLLFFDSYKNIIAENDFRNLAFGVALNAAFKSPLLWNTVRDNRFVGIREAYRDAMQGGDSTRHSTCFCESVVGNAGEGSGWDSYNVWYTVGNVFRNNFCADIDTSAEIATNRWNNIRNSGIDSYFGEEKGNALTVIENNTFTSASSGVLVGNPAYWSLVRNNSFDFKEKDGFDPSEIVLDQPASNFKLLYMKDDAVEMDANNTVCDSCGEKK